MSLKFASVTFDCADPRKVAAFWSAALGRPIDEGATDDVVFIGHGTEMAWYFQRVPEPKTAKNARTRTSTPTIEERSPACVWVLSPGLSALTPAGRGDRQTAATQGTE